MKNFDIEKVKKRTLVKYPFFGSIIASTELISSTKVQTAGTDGNKIIYNPEYLASLSKDEQTFILAHEICHIAFNHVGRRKNKEKKTWNMATDSVINAFLQSDGLKLAPGGVDIPEALNHDAEEMYEIFMKQKNSQNNGNDQEKNNTQNSEQSKNSDSINESQNDSTAKDDNENNSSESNENSRLDSDSQESTSDDLGSFNGSGCDDHDFWDDDVNIDDYRESTDKNENDNFEESQDDKESLFDKIREKLRKDNKNVESKNEKTYDTKKEERQKEIEKISQMGEKEAFSENKKQKQDRLQQMIDSLSKDVSSAGKDAGNQRVKLDNIGNARNLIDWRLLLREAVNHEVDWSYRDSEIEDGVLKPYLEDIPIPEAEIVLDTSGSIDDELLRCFLRECKNILKDSRIKAGCFDTKFYGFHEIRTEEDIDNMPFVGRGGTDFNAAINAFSKRVENKIIFTDGYASMPGKAMDAIWVVFGDNEINPPGGRVIYVNEQRLRDIYSFKTK